MSNCDYTEDVWVALVNREETCVRVKSHVCTKPTHELSLRGEQ